MNQDEWDLVQTSDLLEQLMRRFDHAIFSGLCVVKDNGDGTGDNEAGHAWKGCSLTCAGLAGEIKFRILRKRIGTDEPDINDLASEEE